MAKGAGSDTLTGTLSLEGRGSTVRGRGNRSATSSAVAFLILALLAGLAACPAVAFAAPDPRSAAGQSNPPPEPAKAEPAKTPAPASIPVPEVARQAEEVARTLRDLDALLAPSPAIETIEKRLPDIKARIAAQAEVTTRQLEERPSGPTLDALTALWRTTRVELA